MFFVENICMFNTTHIEGSNSPSAVYLMTKLKNKLAKKSLWMQNIVLSNMFYGKYAVAIREFPLWIMNCSY